MSARGPPRHGSGNMSARGSGNQSARGSGSQSARGSRADRSSNWNADKGTGSNGSDSHRSNKGPGGGGFRGQPPRTPRRGGERSGGRDRESLKMGGRQMAESPGRSREEAFGGGSRGGSGRLCRREPLGSHNRWGTFREFSPSPSALVLLCSAFVLVRIVMGLVGLVCSLSQASCRPCLSL